MQMDAINKYSKLDLPVTPTLWLEFHGTEASVAEQAEMVQKITAGHGGANFFWTTRCKFGNYLRIRGGSRKLNANGRTLFANGVRRSVMLFEWLSPSMG